MDDAGRAAAVRLNAICRVIADHVFDGTGMRRQWGVNALAEKIAALPAADTPRDVLSEEERETVECARVHGVRPGKLLAIIDRIAPHETTPSRTASPSGEHGKAE